VGEKIQVNSEVSQIQLPNGGFYLGGSIVILTDWQWHQMTSLQLAAVTDLGFIDLPPINGTIIPCFGAPAGGIGTFGDMAINFLTGDVYGPLSASGWGSPIWSVKNSGASTSPVISVNGDTGEVVLDAANVQALSTSGGTVTGPTMFTAAANATAQTVKAANNQTSPLQLFQAFNGATLGQVNANGSAQYANVATTLKTITSTYSVVATDSFLILNAATAPFTVTLPLAGSFEDTMLILKKVNSSANAVTVQSTSLQTIDGSTSPYVMTSQYSLLKLVSDGNSWWII
jgi:hypothetical protein